MERGATEECGGFPKRDAFAARHALFVGGLGRAAVSLRNASL